MAHLRTTRRKLRSTSLHEQTATAATLPTLNNKAEHLLGPDTTCTGCRSEQKGLQPPYSVLHTPSPSCTQLPRSPRHELKQTREVLGCERRPNARRSGQRHENHHTPEATLRESATEPEHQPPVCSNTQPTVVVIRSTSIHRTKRERPRARRTNESRESSSLAKCLPRPEQRTADEPEEPLCPSHSQTERSQTRSKI
ncbi:hypothetical protein Bca4012_007231 [Brassica carinata]